MNEKQQQLTFEKGITNVPSDVLCSDNALSYAQNLIYRNGEHQVIQKPKLKENASYKLLFVHKLQNGQDNYIYDSGTLLYYGGSQISNSAHTTAIKHQHIRAIGKTLIVSMGGKLSYYLYKNSSYQFIGNTIPRPKMAFGMDDEPGTTITGSMSQRTTYFKYVPLGSIQGVESGSDYHITDLETYDNSVKGKYAEGKKKAAQQKAFVLPFFVRYALKLYDGTYTHISNPIPLFPNATMTCFWTEDYRGFWVHAMYLKYRNYQTYGDWTDIVKGISVFITKGTEIYDLTLMSNEYGIGDYNELAPSRFATNASAQERIDAITMVRPFVIKTDSELADELDSESVFYHLCDISPTTTVNTWKHLKDHFSHVTLENITTQEQLPYDNYYSLAPLDADYLHDYNNRLNLAHVKRGFFDGFDSYNGLYRTTNLTLSIYVRIASESGTRVVYKQASNTREMVWWYFFYPDPRANHVTIYNGTTCILDEDLIEHEGLNGAYFLKGWPNVRDITPTTASATLGPNDIDTTPEELFSYIITSEVNNPFVFKAEGYNRIGSGNVIGMSTMTQALSQGQFGQYPLIVFTTEGIWAMSVDNTGLYQSIHPMSREVCVDVGTITQTDGAVFFVSKRGLMVVAGSDVKCVSEQLSGKTNQTERQSFYELFYGCFIAYDYRDSLLWIFNTDSHLDDKCLTFSIKEGTFAFNNTVTVIDNVVSNYPDYLLQDTSKKIYTLYGRDDINSTNEQNNNYAATIITRPLKLENALALKSIMQIKHICDMEPTYETTDSTTTPPTTVTRPKLTLKIEASNNARNWVELKSLRGVPWKYYRFTYTFAGLKATDRFAGTMLITQERRTDKLR